MQTGKFTLQENCFYAGDKKLLIRKRKKASKKPELYLIQLKPFQYISSLFPVEGKENAYTFDYEQRLYELRKKKNLVEVEEIG